MNFYYNYISLLSRESKVFVYCILYTLAMSFPEKG